MPTTKSKQNSRTRYQMKRAAEKEQRKQERKAQRRQKKVDKSIACVVNQSKLQGTKLFPILLENAFYALGYRSEIKARKDLLKLDLEEGKDYIVKQGKQKEFVRLTVDGFLCWADENGKGELHFHLFPEEDEYFWDDDLFEQEDPYLNLYMRGIPCD
ncbi:MAG: hypothetical protein F6J90_31370 [Moorea sp. SIOASIH]|uniref:hypothetical protein n=1 Tax=Moorena sp. SIOASIH TaxID=2607817 RepID=UPI0013BC7859|nr:hypothetical protein [Moorena sp. SIOASIH]NEO40592.1 hypothetical protein [Moorena sp. SIOASIH]NEO96820.1 hypothetical protein [Moorena sp. SIO3G5]